MRRGSRKLYAIIRGDKQAFVKGKSGLAWLTIIGPSGPRLNLDTRLFHSFREQLEPGSYTTEEGVESGRPGPRIF